MAFSRADLKIEILGSRDKHPLPRGVSKALADPLVQALMAADGVDRSNAEALFAGWRNGWQGASVNRGAPLDTQRARSPAGPFLKMSRRRDHGEPLR
jgi:hypothetical protein